MNEAFAFVIVFALLISGASANDLPRVRVSKHAVAPAPVAPVLTQVGSSNDGGRGSGVKAPSLLDSVMSVDLIVKEFRAPLLSKLIDMTTNFIMPHLGAGPQQFIAVGNRVRSCPQRVRESGARPIVGQFEYSAQLDETKTAMSEVLDYYGCRGRITLRESIYTTGKGLNVLGAKPYLDGTVNFSFGPQIESRRIRYTDENDIELFEFLSLRTPEGETHKLIVQDKVILNIVVRESSVFKDVIIKAPSSSVVMTLLGSPYGVRYSLDWEFFRFRERDDGFREFEVGNSGVRRSALDFQKAFNAAVVDSSLAAVKGVLKVLVNDLPNTEFGGNAGKTQKFTEDLLLTKRRLESKDQLDEVLKTVTSILEGISSGKIIVIDKRED